MEWSWLTYVWSLNDSFVRLYYGLGGSYDWVDLCYNFVMIHLSACNMVLEGGGGVVMVVGDL